MEKTIKIYTEKEERNAAGYAGTALSGADLGTESGKHPEKNSDTGLETALIMNLGMGYNAVNFDGARQDKDKDGVIRGDRERSQKMRLPSWALFIILFLTFTLAEFYNTRNIMASMMLDSNYSFLVSYSAANFLYYFLVGLIMTGIFELCAYLMLRAARMKKSVGQNYIYYMRLVYCGINILVFGIRLLYLAFPLMQFFGEAVLVTLVSIAGFFLFYYLALKNNVADGLYKSAHLRSLSMFYFGVTFVTVIINIVSGVGMIL